MKIGIGIDTGGTCTDGVIYDFDREEIMAHGKSRTTKEDLSIGIGALLDTLPKELVAQADVIALSTTLATNACVENKGGRAKLVLFGIDPSTVLRVGKEYGLTMDDSLVFIPCKTKPTGEVIEQPDWAEFSRLLHERFHACQAVGVVEIYAKRSGAGFEKKARELIQQALNIPVVCGYELFSQSNMVKRGASALLNARLIPVIREFLSAVKQALHRRDIKAPLVIVRSDGSLMSEEFTATHPVETLLCGPVSSVMGAVKLTRECDAMIVDIGGTTTDVAFVKQGIPERTETGVRIGRWDTFVKGLFVDTFGLGGDSGVIVSEGALQLESERVTPLCMAAYQYPGLLRYLEREDARGYRMTTQQHQIYLRIKDIRENTGYTNQEQDLAALFAQPQSLAQAGEVYGSCILQSKLERLIREGVLTRCGITPTDAMHVHGDFTAYSVEAARYGLSIMARTLNCTIEETCEEIYRAVKKKLYSNLVRILLEDTYPELRKGGIGSQMEQLVGHTFEPCTLGDDTMGLHTQFTTPLALIGVGAPTRFFLRDVGKQLGTNVFSPEYGPVANALGAIVSHVCANVETEVSYVHGDNTYVVAGGGEREIYTDLDRAKQAAEALAERLARSNAVEQGADGRTIKVSVKGEEHIAKTDFGTFFLSYSVQATASSKLLLA